MVISKELIHLQLNLNTKESILDYLIDQANANGKLNNPTFYKEAVLKREEEFSTALGYMIAIPHGQSDGVNEPFVVVANTIEAFKWDSRNDNEVKLIFMIGVPMENREKTHLEILANISRNLMDDEFREKMIYATDKEEAYQTLMKLEKLV